MTAFMIGAALLLLTTLAFVLPALLRKEQTVPVEAGQDQLNLAVLRDQLRELDADLAAGTIEREAYDSARQDLEQRVLEEVQPQQLRQKATGNQRWTAVAVGVLVPGLAAVLYLQVGEPNALDPKQHIAQAQPENGHDITPQQIEGMVAALAQRLQNDPSNAEGWLMLARSYNAIGKFTQASEAYARLVALIPDDAGLLADYADTLAMASDRNLLGEPEKLIARALEADPNNVKALALAGTAAFERGKYEQAVNHWERIGKLVPAESDIARSIAASIDEARGMMGKPTAMLASAAPQTAAATGATVQGVVDLDPALRAQVSPDDTVFIFARAATGPHFPLAVLRKQVKDLPVAFTLDDSMSMTPEAKLSSAAELVVGARVSKSGSATPGPGDLEGLVGPVAPGAQDLKVRIDKRNG